MKIYAVKKGRKPGLYNSWDECNKQTNKFPGAIFKSFTNKLEAEEWLGLNSQESDFVKEVNKVLKIESREQEIKKLDRYDSIFYTDGSYNQANKMYGSGFIETDGLNNIIFKHFEGGKDIDGSRNIIGEIIAVIRAIEHSLRNHYKSILICYDYKGLENWCKGTWKTKNVMSHFLKNTYDLYSNIINIDFEYIPGHSGNEFNDAADYLAKKGSKIVE